MTGPRAVVCGYGEIATVGLECLLEAGWKVALFVTHERSPAETLWWRPPEGTARGHGIPVVAPGDVNGPGEAARIATLRPDFLFSFYFRSMIRPALLQVPRRGALNLHGSLLPRYRGRAPLNWVLVNGETETGVTLHYMDELPDHGDIVAQRRVPIDITDTAYSLFAKLVAETRVLLRETLPLLAAGTAPREPQDHERASYFGRRTPEDGCIDWEWPAPRIYNLVRAVTRPFPGAFTTLRGRRLTIWKSECGTLEGPRLPPGRVVGLTEHGALVAAWEGVVEIECAQLEGEEERSGPDSLGAILPPGTVLGS